MKAVPFGEVRKERIEISKKYKLIEVVNGIWRLTDKCKNNYDPISYFKYLQGKVEIPTRASKHHSKVVESKKRVVIPTKKKLSEKEVLVQQILDM